MIKIFVLVVVPFLFTMMLMCSLASAIPVGKPKFTPRPTRVRKWKLRFSLRSLLILMTLVALLLGLLAIPNK